MPKNEDAGSHLYIHIPFCAGKCAYCAFYSVPYDEKKADTYLQSLAAEIDLYVEKNSKPVPQTIYFGGGTPSILNAAQLDELCSMLRERVDASHLREWTLEANPNTLPPEKLRILKDFGVNRVSIGAQSFDDRILDSIGRPHVAADIAPTVEVIRAAGIENIGLDLIACLPRVDDEMWHDTLQKAIQLQPKHISVYALTVEAGSRFARCGFRPPDDEEQNRVGEIAERMLEDASFERYEISNYNKAGFECRHNVSCWRGEDYIGLGPAASSRSCLKRWTNKPKLGDYIAALANHKLPPREEETLSPETDSAERVMFAFRLLKEGVILSNFGSADLVSQWEQILTRLASDGFVERRNNRWFLTHRGRNFADHVAAQFVGTSDQGNH